MENKLEFLLNQANIGTYSKCEIIEIFGYNKETQEAFNIYTLVVFENTKQIDIQELMTAKLQPFKGHKSLSWGINRRIVEIEVVKKLYLELFQYNKFEIDKSINIGKVQLLQEQYVPPREDMHHEIQLNNILKNNFKNGSYILEFFDEEKHNVQFLLDDAVLLKQFSEVINKTLPIKISDIYERIGNIIFQLPINNFDINLNSIIKENPRRYSGINIKFFQKNNFNITQLAVRIFEYNSDELITRQKFIDVENSILNIELDDCFGTHIEVIDKTNSLIVYKYKYFIMKHMHTNISVMEPQNRVSKINENIHKIQVSTNASHSVREKEKNKPFDEWIRNRKYEQELKELEKSKAFVQYFGNQEEKALNDVRELINKYGEKGIYIWDPYLSAIDIKNTLYYYKTTYIPMRAISGLKQHKSKEQAKSDMIEEFKKDDKQFLFLNLEVRGKIGSNGYDFHDRFLIFPLEQPKVWSLGISVKQLGKSHHILQEVKNAQHILNAFNKLWDELNSEECLVWKSN